MTWWVLTRLYNARHRTALYTAARTNVPDHLFMAWAHHKPTRHPVWKTIRGKRTQCGFRWIWDTPNITEQSQDGDTLQHSFHLADLPPTAHTWYYLFAPDGPYGREIQGPLVHIPPWLVEMASARIFHSVNQPAPSLAITTLTFDSVLWDDGGFYDPAEPTRLTAPVPGLYLVGANAALKIFAADKWWMEIMKNGPPGIVHHSHWVEDTGWAGGTISLQTIVALDAEDYLETRISHSGPGGDEIQVMPDYSPHFWIAYLGPNPT